MKQTNIYIFFLGLILVTLLSCSTERNGAWIETIDNGTKIWISQVDTTLNYQWDGEIFDSIAHGKGNLLILQKDSVIERHPCDAYYGALLEDDIVMVGDNETYVGRLSEEKFNGYGVYYKKGDVYIGTFVDSRPQGYVAWYKDGKPYYVGNWDNGSFHGEGTLYKEDGTVKSGDWDHGNLVQTLADVQLKEGHYNGYVKNNKPDGLGKMEYANGVLYSGKWKDGKYNGQGVLIQGADTIVGDWDKGKVSGDVLYRTNSFFYEGTMVDNLPTGIGNLTVEDYSYYTGNWIDGKRTGIGEVYYINGDSYIGEWDNDQFDGVGKYVYDSSNASYDGEWKDGLQDGQGYYRSPEFAYRGEWEKGWMDGEGTLVFKNGDKYEGTIHENIIDGIGTYTFNNGNFYEGEFVEGQITGLGVFHFKNGTTFEGEFQNGKIYGDGTLNLVENDKVVSITGFWLPDGSFPKEASILFPTGDLYEGPLTNGYPTDAGTWISGEERAKNIDKIENSTLHKANELYKRNRETIDWCLMGVSAAVTAVEVCTATSIAGTPIAAIAQGVNMAINVVDAGMSIASASLDTYESETLGEDSSEAWQNLGTEIGMNVAFIVIPKAAKGLKKLGKPLKNVTRSAVASLGLKNVGKQIIKKSAIKFVKSKIYGKTIKLSVKVQGGTRKIEKALVRNKVTRKPMIAAGRILTGIKHQTVSYNSYLKKIKSNPNLKDQLKLSVEGRSANLGANMRLLGTDKWVHKNERIRRYLKFPKRQVEPHHLLPSNPVSSEGKKAREIWVKYFGSVDHPCNGIWLGRNNKKLGYYGLAKGSNHSPNSLEYEKEIANRINKIFERFKGKYANNPDMMQLVLAETLDEAKKDIFKGRLAIGKDSHTVHTALSIFKNNKGVATEAAKSLLNPQLIPTF